MGVGVTQNQEAVGTGGASAPAPVPTSCPRGGVDDVLAVSRDPKHFSLPVTVLPAWGEGPQLRPPWAKPAPPCSEGPGGLSGRSPQA